MQCSETLRWEKTFPSWQVRQCGTSRARLPLSPYEVVPMCEVVPCGGLNWLWLAPKKVGSGICISPWFIGTYLMVCHPLTLWYEPSFSQGQWEARRFTIKSLSPKTTSQPLWNPPYVHESFSDNWLRWRSQLNMLWIFTSFTWTRKLKIFPVYPSQGNFGGLFGHEGASWEHTLEAVLHLKSYFKERILVIFQRPGKATSAWCWKPQCGINKRLENKDR